MFDKFSSLRTFLFLILYEQNHSSLPLECVSDCYKKSQAYLMIWPNHVQMTMHVQGHFLSWISNWKVNNIRFNFSWSVVALCVSFRIPLSSMSWSSALIFYVVRPNSTIFKRPVCHKKLFLLMIINKSLTTATKLERNSGLQSQWFKSLRINMCVCPCDSIGCPCD